MRPGELVVEVARVVGAGWREVWLGEALTIVREARRAHRSRMRETAWAMLAAIGAAFGQGEMFEAIKKE